MLKITIPAQIDENWDWKKEEFIYIENEKEQTLCLEHSLVSLSKWESKWCKPFLSSEKTNEAFLDYIKCMTLNHNVSDDVYDRLTIENIEEIQKYVKAPMTATTFSKEGRNHPSREIVTSELIYYWMISMNIPVEFEKWHINRLITLIRVCSIKNTPPKKHSKREIMNRNAALNAARKRQLNTTG